MIRLKLVFESISFLFNQKENDPIRILFELIFLWFDQDRNDPIHICFWIDLFTILPRGKFSNSNLCLDRLDYDLT